MNYKIFGGLAITVVLVLGGYKIVSNIRKKTDSSEKNTDETIEKDFSNGNYAQETKKTAEAAKAKMSLSDININEVKSSVSEDIYNRHEITSEIIRDSISKIRAEGEQTTDNTQDFADIMDALKELE